MNQTGKNEILPRYILPQSTNTGKNLWSTSFKIASTSYKVSEYISKINANWNKNPLSHNLDALQTATNRGTQKNTDVTKEHRRK
jgi:hypothetical protein